MTPEEQRKFALAKADEVRFARADLKRELRFGMTKLHEALERPCAQSMEIGKLLCSLPGVWEITAERVLKGLQITSTRTVGQLTSRQRQALVEAVP